MKAEQKILEEITSVRTTLIPGTYIPRKKRELDLEKLAAYLARSSRSVTKSKQNL